MPTPRHSVSSTRSGDATAVDPESPPHSPNKIMGRGEQRASSDSINSRPQSNVDRTSQRSCTSSSEEHEHLSSYGWPHLAEKMAQVPEYAAFPRFRELNVKSLLYYQAQLKSLQQKILLQEQESTLNMRRYDHLVEDTDSDHHKLHLELRILLREYNEAIIQYSHVSALPDPEAYNMCSLRRWLVHEDGGDATIRSGRSTDKTWGDLRDDGVPQNFWKHCRTFFGALIWSKPPSKVDLDLVMTHPETKIDGLTKWIVYNLAPLYWTWHEIRNRKALKNPRTAANRMSENIPGSLQTDEEAQTGRPKAETAREMQNTVRSISELTALRFTASISTVIACLIPVVAISVLTQVKGTRDILLCIAGFAIIFAVGLILLTQGTSSRTEIFAATAAFSAVLVVFISQPAIDIQMPPGTQAPVINL